MICSHKLEVSYLAPHGFQELPGVAQERQEKASGKACGSSDIAPQKSILNQVAGGK